MRSFKNGPWLVHNVPLILINWYPNENLSKEDLSNIFFWIIFYDVSLTAFIEDELSAMESKFGTPLMLDAYTIAMLES